MMKNTILYYTSKGVIGLFLVLFSACNKLVEVPVPKSELVTPSVFSDPATATAALLSIYSRMNDPNLHGFMVMTCGVLGDEFSNFSSEPSDVSIYSNDMDALNACPSNLWNTPYTLIFQANAVLEGANSSNRLDAKVKQQLAGEALFARSFWLYYLTSFWGDVPVPVSTDYNVNRLLPRTDARQVLQIIATDLLTAEGMVDDKYMNASSSVATTDRVRPNKAAVRALLARVYLALGDFVNAERYASLVIDDARYKLTGLNEVFLTNSAEAIWQIMQPVAAANQATYEGQDFVLNSIPSKVAISPRFMQDFETGDERFSNWVGSYTNEINGLSYLFVNKYKLRVSATPAERTTVLRLAEQHLIRAEARAQLGNQKGAAGDLTLIRKRAGLKGEFKEAGKQETLAAVAHERKMELFGEWGHRWIDMKRMNIIDQVMGKETPLKGGQWQIYKRLWPVPEIERRSNANLSQNAGY